MTNNFRLKWLEGLLWIFAAAFAYPILYVVNMSLKTASEISSHPLALPKSLSFANYVHAFKESHIPLAFGNSFLLTTATVALSIALGSMASYPLSRTNTRAIQFIYFLFISGIMMPVQLGILPLYQIARSLGIINTYFGYIVIATASQLPFAVFL
jgi:raffinose/stachyose/melibiose transport system permease protein